MKSNELRKHFVSSSKYHSYKCKICKKTFKSINDIKEHFILEHMEATIKLRKPQKLYPYYFFSDEEKVIDGKEYIKHAKIWYNKSKKEKIVEYLK